MSENKEMVRGTFLITISILITKILGVLFVIPFMQSWALVVAMLKQI